MNTMVSQADERTISVHNEHEFLLKMEKAGLTDELAQKVIDSKGNDLATKVVGLIQRGGYEATTSQKRAHEIMGKNFFGVEEAIKHFGVNSTKQQLAILSEIPFSEAVLQECKDTHVFVAIFPISILEIRGKVQDKGLFYSQDWHNQEKFAKEHGEVSWQLVRKTPVSNSTSKTWNEQQSLLAKDEETPTAQVMVYTIIGHFMATNERLFEQVYVHCSDISSDGLRVDVGSFGWSGLDVSHYWDGTRHGLIGLSSVRKV
ncbi:hypothetical protein KKE19_01745 [Patescibacteria group bacterium]|nr:hypothetical protein [Patescibacteria group bacterium]MBU4367421.1 hypothetical protein [Patescibacteria group bacterium]MBU4461741.1 hypothetical protein [Patescibacteria group bacterium]MCG2700125.1 hypothetical protein [Candidatus Parcubacteria bacterium]